MSLSFQKWDPRTLFSWLFSLFTRASKIVYPDWTLCAKLSKIKQKTKNLSNTQRSRLELPFSEKNSELTLCSFWNFKLTLVHFYLFVFQLFYLCSFFFVRFFNYLTFVRFSLFVFSIILPLFVFLFLLRLSILNCFSSYMYFLFKP